MTLAYRFPRFFGPSPASRIPLASPSELTHLAAMNGVGILAGLTTAVLWTATAVCFEISSRRLGTWLVNVVRLSIAAALFVALSLIRTGRALPAGLTPQMWRDLALSGGVGFVAGDLMLFRALVLIGARRSMLVYASVPTLTGILGYFFLGETLGKTALIGMLVTCVGVALAIRSSNGSAVAKDSWRTTFLGIGLAFGGSIGQSAGLLLGKTGSVGIDCFAATEVRVLAGWSGFLFLGGILGRLGAIAKGLTAYGREWVEVSRSRASGLRKSMSHPLALLTWGAILGPFLGVALGLKSTQLLPTGIASTLMSIVPVLLIPVSVLLFKEKVGKREILGTVVALVGVGLLAW